MPKLDADDPEPEKPAPGRWTRPPSPKASERGDVGVTPQPVRVATGTADEEGRLVFHGGKPAAVLVRLSDAHEGMAGLWFPERGFAGLDDPSHPTFDGLDPVCVWIARRLGPGAAGPM